MPGVNIHLDRRWCRSHVIGGTGVSRHSRVAVPGLLQAQEGTGYETLPHKSRGKRPHKESGGTVAWCQRLVDPKDPQAVYNFVDVTCRACRKAWRVRHR